MKTNKTYLKWIAKYLKKNEGFSLIELMIVVAIIGVLVAVAVPNFQKFLGRAKQTEAKTNLGTIYAAQKAFHGEWNTYFNNFTVIGYAPEGILKYHISNGTGPQNVLPNTHPEFGALAGVDLLNNTATYCSSTTPVTPCTENNKTADPTGITISKYTTNSDQTVFESVAISNLDGDGGRDVWTINQQKDLKNAVRDF